MITVTHAKVNNIPDFTQDDLDAQIALGNFPPGTTLADIALPSDWNDDHELSGLGTAAEQNVEYFDLAGAADTAQSNAEAFASDASNLSTGTVSTTVLPVATTSDPGIMRPDGVSIVVVDGVISATGVSEYIGQTTVNTVIQMTDANGILNIDLSNATPVQITGAANRTPWKEYTICDCKGLATPSLPIVYTPANGNTILGQPNWTIQQAWDSITVYADEAGNEFIK